MAITEEMITKMRAAVDDYFENAEPTTILSDLARELADEAAIAEADAISLKYAQAWSEMANKLVGG